MSFKYGADWDWEQSLRAEEIKEAIKAGKAELAAIEADMAAAAAMTNRAMAAAGLANRLFGIEALAAVAKIKKIIDGLRPVSSGPEWRFAFILESGSELVESDQVSTGISKASSGTFSLENSCKVGFNIDVFSSEISSKTTATTKVETIMSSSHVKTTQRKYSFPYDACKENESHVYYQLSFIIKYADNAESLLSTKMLRRVTGVKVDHKGHYPRPLQTAEDAWANLSR